MLRAPFRGGTWRVLTGFCLTAFFLVAAPAWSESSGPGEKSVPGGPASAGRHADAFVVNPAVSILLSRNIRPYFDALDGISDGVADGLPDAKIHRTVFTLSDYPPERAARLEEKLKALDPDLLITVGPEALRMVELRLDRLVPRLLYSMILHPRSILGPDAAVCGVAMDIPLIEQLRTIRSALPGIRLLGLLYDPVYNETRFRRAKAALKNAHFATPLVLTPIPVSLKDIRRKLDRSWEHIDALWFIPDQTVKGESLIRQILKESISRNIPAIGFNRLFYDSGATLSFVLDYKEIGRKTGRMAVRYLHTGDCRPAGPAYQAWINSRVVRRIGATVRLDAEAGIVEGP